jgi:acylphosphatase
VSEPARDGARFVVHGRVQGVGFRWFARRTARTLGLTGWVRNHEDGAVEIEAVGSAEALARFREELRRGPGHSWVSDLEERELAPVPSFDDFEIVP